MSGPSVLLISYHFYPSTEIGARRVSALARYLAQAGFRVVVISEFGGESYVSGSEIWPGVVAIPVALPSTLLVNKLVWLRRRKKTTREHVSASKVEPASLEIEGSQVFRRLRNIFFKVAYFLDRYKRWSARAAVAAVKAGRRWDSRLVFSSGPPYSVLLAGTRVASRLKIPHIVDLRDPWSDQLAPQSLPANLELRFVRLLERRVMKSSAAITSTAAVVGQLLCTRCPELRHKIHVIRNGFDGEIAEGEGATDHRLSILFAGDLYVGRDPFPLLQALEDFLADSTVDAHRITLTFMGRCATYKERSLEEWLHGKRSEAVVKVLGHAPPEVVEETVRHSTVLLNLAQQQSLSVPAKTFEHLARRREILLLSEKDSETAQVVAGITGVIQVDPRESGALDRVLRDLYQRHVVQGKLAAPAPDEVLRFSRAFANDKFLTLMRTVATLD